jgi:hypothetical protein
MALLDTIQQFVDNDTTSPSDSAVQKEDRPTADTHGGPKVQKGGRIRGWGDLLSLPVTDKAPCDFVASYTSELTTDDSDPYDDELWKLERVSRQIMDNMAPSVAFTEIIDSIDWCNKQPLFFRHVIDLALQLELIELARKLADSGSKFFPANQDLKKAAEILAPPKVIATNRPPQKGLSASMEWFERHANEYRGLWVAVSQGRLIEAAQSRNALTEKLGSLVQKPGILIVRIP